MELIETFVVLLEGASPYVVTVVGILAIVYMILMFLERKSRRDMAECTRDEVGETNRMLAAHISVEDEKGETELALLKRMTHQLVQMNATMTGQAMSIADARVTIRYQWNWFRDEVSHIIRNSIKNNNFRGRELTISRKVSAAWQQAATKAKQSLDQLQSMQYPYERLFDNYASLVCDQVWALAVPLYHRDIPNGVGNIQEALDGLEQAVRETFETVLVEYFAITEDLEHGQLYNPVLVDTASAASHAVIDPDALADRLKSYCVGDGSDAYPPTNIREHMRATTESYSSEH